MNAEQTQGQTNTSSRTDDQASLQGRQLILARIGWMLVLVLSLGLFIAFIPFTFADLHVLCTSATCIKSGHPTPAQVYELQHLGLSLDFWIIFGIVISTLLEIGYVAIGLLIFWHASNDRMALISSLALVTFGNSFHNSNPLTPLPPVPHAISLFMAFFGSICLGLFLYTFPTGRFAPRWTRWLALLWIVYWGVHYLILSTFLTNSGASFVIFAGLLVSIITVQAYRYRRVFTPEQRQQTKWVIFGLTVAFLDAIISLALFNLSLSIVDNTAIGTLFYVCLLLIPLSIGIAILRYHLWDIDIIINRALVYTLLTLSIVGMYMLVVSYLEALFRTTGNLLISLIATGAVAVLFQPLRVLLQRGVSRLLYGQRDEPYSVITGLSQRLETTLAPDAVLPAIVETVAQALKLPYAAILLQHEDTFAVNASYGQQQGEPLTLPLIYQRETVGKLLLAPRAPSEAFTPADLRLLNELAHQIGLAAYAVRLTSDLRRSNEYLQAAQARLVTTREEERRRLRRDLHDGLGSALTSVTFQLDAACNLLDRNPQQVKAMLKDLKMQTQASIVDIRRLIYNLRPPILDEWGLVAALREQVAQYQLDNVQVTIDAPEPLPPLTAAAEVAAYRIILEALANVIRHALASTCLIRLSISDDTLSVVVQDNGCGLPQGFHMGVGIAAMRERATELGGSCIVETLAAGGTRVSAMLPLVKE
ncbi:MAG: hypothetical protein NVSMB44_14130 [Ktedonobacteraceae bacterium]